MTYSNLVFVVILFNVLAGSLADIVRHVQIWWLVGAFCVIGVVIAWGIPKNR
ncbi:MAG: hypothetical protein WAZ77_09215 [Candidatus Nitrosopolaris sp.]